MCGDSPAPHCAQQNSFPDPSQAAPTFPEHVTLPPRLLGTLLWRGEAAADQGRVTHTAESPVG